MIWQPFQSCDCPADNRPATALCCACSFSLSTALRVQEICSSGCPEWLAYSLLFSMPMRAIEWKRVQWTCGWVAGANHVGCRVVREKQNISLVTIHQAGHPHVLSPDVRGSLVHSLPFKFLLNTNLSCFPLQLPATMPRILFLSWALKYSFCKCSQGRFNTMRLVSNFLPFPSATCLLQETLKTARGNFSCCCWQFLLTESEEHIN